MTRTVALFVALAELTTFLYAVDFKGLEEETKIKITGPMIGSVVPGSRPASVWAVSFSPDEQYIAVGVEFSNKKSAGSPVLDDRSYLLILAIADPLVVIKKFEIPRQPAMRVYPPLRWTADGRYIATPFYNDWQHVAVAEVASGKLSVISNEHCNLEGLLPGPEVVQRCTTSSSDSLIRITRPSGEVLREWKFPPRLTVFGVESALSRIAIATGADMKSATHEIVVFDANDRKEIGHWTLSGSAPYFGTFAPSGESLCAIEGSSVPNATDLICWNIASATQSHRITLPVGWSRFAIGGGNLVGLEHSGVRSVPKFLQSIAGTSYFLANSTRRIWDLRTSREVAELSIRTQWVLPRLDAPYAWTISPTGNFVAEGGTGLVTIYRVPGITNPQSIP